jgi:ABC-type sugar transport system substrate-binding protein
MEWLKRPLSSDRPSRRLPLVLAACLVVAMLVSACGSDSDSGSTGGGTTAASTEETGGETGGDAETDPFAAMEALYEGYDGEEAGLPTEYPEPKSGPVKIGWLNPFGAQPVLAAQQSAAEAQTANLGGTIKTADDQLQPDKQVSNFQSMLDQGVDGIEFIPIDPGATAPLLAQAQKEKVPVIAFDQTNTLKEDAGPISTQIWQGRDHQAYAMAKKMSELQPNGKIGLIGFGFPVPNIQFLMERLEFWAGEFGLTVVGQVESKADDASGGEGAMQGLLKDNVAGVICYTDQVCVGAGASAKQAGQQVDTVAVGGGPAGTEAVQNGQLTATLQTDAVQQGLQAVNAIYALKAGEEVPPVVLRAPLQLIDEATVGNVVSWDSELAEVGGGK